MNKTLQEWMLLAIGVIAIAALIWGAMYERAKNIQERIDQELSISNHQIQILQEVEYE